MRGVGGAGAIGTNGLPGVGLPARPAAASTAARMTRAAAEIYLGPDQSADRGGWPEVELATSSEELGALETSVGISASLAQEVAVTLVRVAAQGPRPEPTARPDLVVRALSYDALPRQAVIVTGSDIGAAMACRSRQGGGPPRA